MTRPERIRVTAPRAVRRPPGRPGLRPWTSRTWSASCWCAVAGARPARAGAAAARRGRRPGSAACRCCSPLRRRRRTRLGARRAAAVAAARRARLPRAARPPAGCTCGSPSGTSGTSSSWSSARDAPRRTDARRGRAGRAGHRRHRRLRVAAGPHHLRLPRRVPHGEPAVGRERDRRGVPVGRQLPRRRRAWCWRTASTCSGTRSASSPATWCCCCSSPRRCAAPARTRCPDFAEARLGSPGAAPAGQRVSSSAIGWLYLVPQLQGAGLTLRATTGAPSWVGAVVVAVVVTGNVAGGGMRSATFVQAFQYWLKLTALAVPALVLVLAWQADGAPTAAGADGPPVLRETTVVRVDAAVRVDASPGRVAVQLDGGADGAARLDRARAAGSDRRRSRPARPSRTSSGPGAGRPGGDWARPLSGAGGLEHPLYATYSLVLATFLGTMGLPHVLVRFYTNPDGGTARRTTLVVLALLGVFYLLPTAVRRARPALHPRAAAHRPAPTPSCSRCRPRRWSAARPASCSRRCSSAGAFAAFLSTSSGLLVSIAGVLCRTCCAARCATSGGPRCSPAWCRWRWRCRPSRPARRPGRRTGLRRRGVDVLPAAGARHLVARADRARRGRRAAGRRRAVDRRGGGDAGRGRRVRLAGGAARPAGRLDGADRVRASWSSSRC